MPYYFNLFDNFKKISLISSEIELKILSKFSPGLNEFSGSFERFCKVWFKGMELNNQIFL